MLLFKAADPTQPKKPRIPKPTATAQPAAPAGPAAPATPAGPKISRAPRAAVGAPPLSAQSRMSFDKPPTATPAKAKAPRAAAPPAPPAEPAPVKKPVKVSFMPRDEAVQMRAQKPPRQTAAKPPAEPHTPPLHLDPEHAEAPHLRFGSQMPMFGPDEGPSAYVPPKHQPEPEPAAPKPPPMRKQGFEDGQQGEGAFRQGRMFNTVNGKPELTPEMRRFAARRPRTAFQDTLGMPPPDDGKSRPTANLSDSTLAALRRYHITTRPQKLSERMVNRKQGKQQFFTPELEHRHPSEVLGDDQNPWLEDNARHILENHEVKFRPYTLGEKLKNTYYEKKYGLPQGYYGSHKAILSPRAQSQQISYDNRKETGLTDSERPDPKLRVAAENHERRAQMRGKGTHTPRIGHRLPFLFRKFS